MAPASTAPTFLCHWIPRAQVASSTMEMGVFPGWGSGRSCHSEQPCEGRGAAARFLCCPG